MSEHFNQLTPAQAERLAILAEEAGEIVQAVGKILRHGYASTHPNGGPDNRGSLTKEVGDLFATVALMVDAGDLNEDAVEQAADDKLANGGRYHHHQEELA